MRIGVFGGSFDPPHTGHISLIKKVLASGLVDEVWLMPNFSHPWRKSVASPSDRLAMCKLLAGKKVKVFDLEIKKGGVSYTIETVRELKTKCKSYKFYWLIGKDIVKELPRWKDIEKLKKEIEFLSFPRTSVSSSKIRERIKKGLSITGMVPKKVEEYIKKHKLYV